MMARLAVVLGFLLIVIAGLALSTLVVLPLVESYRNQPTLMQLQAAINCPAGFTFEQQFSATNTQLGGLLPVVTSSCVNATGRATILNEGQETRRGIISAAAVLVPLLVGLSLMVSGRSTINQRQMRAAAAAQAVSQPAFSTVKVWTVNAPAANGGTMTAAPMTPASGALVITTASELRPPPSEPVLLTKPAPAPAPVVEPIIEKANAVVEAVAETRTSPITPPVPMPAVPSAAATTAASTSTASLAQRLQQLEEAFDKNLINSEEFNRLRTALLNEVTKNIG
jgi:hypothetical protein